MKRKMSLFSILFAFVLMLPLLIPSASVEAGTPKPLPRAWAKVKFVYGNAVTLPFGFAPNITISLCTTKNSSYCKTIKSGSNEIALAFKQSAFQFTNVPTGVPILLSIVNYDINGKKFTFNTTYQFSYPSFATTQKLDLAGCMGTLKIDLAYGTITRISDFCN